MGLKSELPYKHTTWNPRGVLAGYFKKSTFLGSQRIKSNRNKLDYKQKQKDILGKFVAGWKR